MPGRTKKSKPYKLYGASGGGSMIVEAAFGFTKLPVEFVDLPWEDTGWNSKALKKLNPLGQVPTPRTRLVREGVSQTLQNRHRHEGPPSLQESRGAKQAVDPITRP